MADNIAMFMERDPSTPLRFAQDDMPKADVLLQIAADVSRGRIAMRPYPCGERCATHLAHFRIGSVRKVRYDANR